jgi:iron complex outermembrane receptor protein
MFKRTKVCAAVLAAIGGGLSVSGSSVFAQDTQRIEITGSAIKRIDSETAVPVTVIKVDDLKLQGVTSIEQAISMLSSSQSQQGTSQSVGAGTGGAAFADMRGLGQNKTLVLLDGRRIADNAIDGSAPDLNMIPFAALDRIEVLRDGASSLYGSDAIGGVINFITKKELRGGQITLQAQKPKGDGGKSSNANVGFGFGNLDTDGFNVLGFVDVQKQDAISAAQRSYASSGIVPSLGLAKSSFVPFPATYFWSDGTPVDPNNPAKGVNYFGANASAPGCNSNGFIFPAGDGTTCRYDYVKWVDLVPKSERTSALLKGTFKINENHQAGLQYFVTRSVIDTNIAPVPSAFIVNPGTKYYPGAGITPSPSATLDPSQPIYAYWRSVPAGPRQGETTNTQQRLLATLEGSIGGWDYNAGLAFNQNKIDDGLTGGYVNDQLIAAGGGDGSFNPFSDQPDAASLAYINSAKVTGRLQTAKGQTTSLDAHASRELGDWFGAGRSSAVAIGTEFRHEKFSDVANAGFATLVQSSSGFDPATNNVGARNVAAIYTELNLPVLKELEFTGALRDDHYSDAGNTLNPKVSARYQPTKQVLLRSSYSTGFRAPSLYELNAPITYTNTANPWNDPVNCPNGVPLTSADSKFCKTQFILQNGGNPDLKPEKSKNFTLGLVLEPIAGTSVGVDLWWIRLQHQIAGLPEELIFGDPTKYAGLFVRNPAGNLSTLGTNCPGVNCGYITDTQSNLGGTNTNGFDLNIASRLRAGSAGNFNFDFTGTYVARYEYQQEEGGEWLQNAGRYSGSGAIFRWVHNASVSWNKDAWGAGLVNHYKSHYTDQNDPGQVPDAAFQNHVVGNYSTWDTYGTWSGIKGFALTVGVRNLFDKDPPASNQGATFQQGYDPRYTDPTGRAYYIRGTYNF